MLDLPSANVTVESVVADVATGTDLICITAPVPTNADITPRLFGNAAAVMSQHGYAEGVEYVALHASYTRKPVLFIGIPIVTQGAIGREDTSGNTGTCVTTLSAGPNGILSEHEGRLVCTRGGTIGTDQIMLSLSCDGGRTNQPVRLGTANSYNVPYIDARIAFAAGTLVTGDVIHTWHGSGPRGDATGWAAARAALAAQLKLFRTWLHIGDLQDSTEAASILAEVEAYDTENERDVRLLASIVDRDPLASMGPTLVRMTGAPNITFAEVGETGDTITRSAGSFVSDGFLAGDLINVTGSADNNIDAVAKVATVAASVLTLDTDDLVAEGPVAGVSIVGHTSLTFANVAETIVRNRGSWLADGFRAGDTIAIAGTVSNDATGKVVETVTASTLTLAAGGVTADEVIRADEVTITAGQTFAAWMAAKDAAFATVTSAPRISLSAGRGRVVSPLTKWFLRRPACWAEALREYQHGPHIPAWRKDLGPTRFSLLDAAGNTVEWDDRVNGKAGVAARFTVFRSWANGPAGAFLGLCLTRAEDSSLLVHAHNADVLNVAMTLTRQLTEALIGQTPPLNDDGTMVEDELISLETEVNGGLALGLLKNVNNEGAYVSSVRWVASREDILNVAEPHLTGKLFLNFNGTIHSVDTTVAILAAGAGGAGG